MSEPSIDYSCPHCGETQTYRLVPPPRPIPRRAALRGKSRRSTSVVCAATRARPTSWSRIPSVRHRPRISRQRRLASALSRSLGKCGGSLVPGATSLRASMSPERCDLYQARWATAAGWLIEVGWRALVSVSRSGRLIVRAAMTAPRPARSAAAVRPWV